MKTDTFEQVAKATGKNFTCERSASGYYRLMCDGETVLDDSACEDVNETEEEAKNFFKEYLLSEEVPEEKKEFRCGMYFLKQ